MGVVSAAKIAAEAARVLKDEKKREAIIAIVLVPIFIVFMLISTLLYIVFAPLEDILGDNKDTVGLTELKSQVSIEYSDESNDDGSYTMDYEKTVIKSGKVDVTYYNQNDNPWKSMMYGTVRTIGISGCGPTSMAIVLSTFTGQEITPEITANWSFQHGYLVQGYSDGVPYAMSSHALIPALVDEYNLSCTGINKDKETAKRLYEALSEGKLVVAIMGPGHFTSGGHFIVLRGVTESGKILVADCASRQRTNREWDIETIINESKGSAGAGGPFWAISK
ncbi:C39 family peptidase [Anaerocolumna chitinilytica]|uniref:Peptidase C39-like domain-containing protein n=1 Tax=Anaerocolumna chitinilytica TaxID=1727145 RepID=A0A7I8DJ09_9FIRM|nr:C39 family peptidase [Anaerocolumna chitinilytica]BCJ98419.1 hypothetical protein bsdcttw_14600 [Anaerocolumna chitinilytica]